MKKFALLLVPLLAVTFLTNCGGQSGTKQFSVVIGTHDHISFIATDGKDLSTIKAIEGQDFKFKMKVDETTSNDTTYKLPTQLSIYIGDSKFPLVKDVTITETTQYLEADVTIAANQITGDIKINGSAVPIDYYKITVFNYGVNIKSEDYDPDFPYAESNKDKDFTFVQDGTYALPTIKDIFLGVDGKNWISPEGSTYCSYDETNHKLTINANKVNSNLTIAIRSPRYNLLENLDWNDINDCSKSGHAAALFKIGEEKTIKVNKIDQKVRIIDFNHDDLWDGKGSAGITFEFVNLLSDSNGYSLATFWDTSNKYSSTNYDYTNSDLRKALDNQGTGTLSWYQKEAETKSTDPNYTKPVIDMLPDELRNNIKTVKKYVATTSSYVVDDKGYNAKVFALTHNEMTEDDSSYAKKEGSTYQYYKDASYHIKHQIKWHDKAATNYTQITDITWDAYNYAGYNNNIDSSYGGYYWLASPYTVYGNSAWNVGFNGCLDDVGYVYRYALAVAPAFCI